MIWRVKNGVVSELKLNQKNLISPWGIETADSSAFFSLEDGFGYRYEILKDDFYSNEKSYTRKMRVKMREGMFDLLINDRIEENKIFRNTNVTFLEDTFLMDFVIRFQFSKDVFSKVCINNKIISHQNRNVNHQYPVEELQLIGSIDLNLKLEKGAFPSNLKFHTYARDAKDSWVVHQRLLPSKWNKEVIKLCSKYFQTRPLPNIISKLLLKSKFIRNTTWYRGEHKPYKRKFLRVFNPNTFPLFKVKKGEVIKLSSSLDFVYDKAEN